MNFSLSMGTPSTTAVPTGCFSAIFLKSGVLGTALSELSAYWLLAWSCTLFTWSWFRPSLMVLLSQLSSTFV